MDFSVESWLRRSGWFPGRAVQEAEAVNVLEKLGFVVSPAARRFLGEFFQLEFAYGEESARGINWMRIDPIRFGHGFQRLLARRYSDSTREEFCPVGLIESDNMNLFVGESGRIYAGVDDLLYLVGKDTNEALGNIFYDREWEEVVPPV